MNKTCDQPLLICSLIYFISSS